MKINKVNIDPIYEHIDIEDGIFEKYLSKEIINKEIERATKIKNLGLISNIFIAATHSKWEHHLGTYHLISKSQEFVNFLNSEDFDFLKLLNYFCCFGYLPLTYCTSEAILIAAKESNNFKKECIEKYFEPVLEKANRYATRKGIPIKLSPNDIIENYFYKALNAWFGAFKLTLKEFIAALKGIYIDKLIYYLIVDDRNNEVKQAYYNFATLDYLQRDLFYTGILNFKIPIRGIFLSDKKVMIDENYKVLIDSLKSSITKQVYCHPAHITLESMVKFRISEMLLTKEISIDDLLQKSDEYLENKIILGEYLTKVEDSDPCLQESLFIDDLLILQSEKM